MDRLGTIFSAVQLASAVLLARSYPTSEVHDHPIHTVVAAFAFTAFALLSINRSLQRLSSQSSRVNVEYNAIPLEDRGDPEIRPKPSTGTRKHDSLSARAYRTVFLSAVVILTLRVELYRRIYKATECTVRSVEVFLPFLISIYDAFRIQAREEEVPDDPDSMYSSPFSVCLDAFVTARSRYLTSAFTISLGCYMASGLWSSSHSTYICPIIGGDAVTIPLLQWICLLLDCFLAVAAYELSVLGGSTSHTHLRGSLAWGSVLASCSFLWIMIGTIVYVLQPELRQWLLPFDLLFNLRLLFALFWQMVLFAALCVSTLYSTTKYGIFSAAINLTVIFVLIPCSQFLWSLSLPFPPTGTNAATVSFILIYLGWFSFWRIRQHMNVDRPTSEMRQFGIFLIFFILVGPGLWRRSQVHFHPIDLLIYEAKVQHEEYAREAFMSRSVGAAVKEYQRRYSRNPPPGFDVWCEYALNRSSIVMDEYDQIYNDLLPFRLQPPEVLRRATWEMVSNPWNEISGITIRNGVAAVQENVLPTHRWMLEGVAILINAFARYLPDMDLAFNLNDEARVAAPYENIRFLREKGKIYDKSGYYSGWSANRSAGWLPIPEHELTETVFRDFSFTNTFARFGSIGCPPKSRARQNSHIYSNSHLCFHCAAPHSLGQFVSNWSLAADVCHQPDLAHLHGFFLSPAAFKTTHDLVPVFSQSKPHGYNDILYPSAWNYMDKVAYAPSELSGGFPDLPFMEKESTLFWRGATSEGVSAGDHSWRGMTRQRLVHMANNLTTSAHDSITILLPDPPSPPAKDARQQKYKYRSLPSTALASLQLPKADMRVVDRISRCGGVDCVDQEAELGPGGVAATDFQAHWRHKYLFDADGAGFSGRFLPFLQSRSLPFKSALFREWYDSRLTAWRHFVPQDLRLHAVWSVLAYFGGVNGTVSPPAAASADGAVPDAAAAEWWRMAPHDAEAQMIADQGRDWAAKVLRKEDMEIYFFRLLLEWARLTDDRRDEMGFSL